MDLDAGLKLHRADMRGTFVLENVEFAYQMRPNEKVLDGVNLTVNGGSTVAFVPSYACLSLSLSLSLSGVFLNIILK